MTLIDRSATLGSLVNDHPELARALEQLGLDYCCHGGRSLADACDSAGLDAETVAVDLAAVANPHPPTQDWAAMDADELVDHIIEVHHTYLWDELPRLAALIAKVTLVHGIRHPELRAVNDTFGELRDELEPHMLKEERVLFPMIRELATATSPPAFHCGTLRNPISVMLAEHDRAGELLALLRDLTQGYAPPADRCASYEACYAGLAELEADTHLHIHKENNLLFPMVVQMEASLAGDAHR